MIGKKIDFTNLFIKLENHMYSIIKLDPEFPNYNKGQDIDIFCRNINEVSSEIVNFLSQYVDKKFKIKISKKINQVHIDLMEKNLLHFRFDLFEEIPKYKNIKIKFSFFDVLIESSQIKDLRQFKIKVPNDMDNCIIRYIEYIEYFSAIPDKIKHIDYINSCLNNASVNRDIFFDRLQHFIAIPTKQHVKKKLITKIFDKLEFFSLMIEKSYLEIKNNGIIFFLKKVKEFMKR